MIIAAQHPISSINYRGYLLQPGKPGDTSIVVDNHTNIDVNHFLAIEDAGSTSGEIVRPTSPISAASIGISSALIFNHNTDSAITILDFDQVEFSKSSDYNPSTGAGTWTVLATVGVDWDNGATYYEDTVSLTSAYYRFRYKNGFNTDPNFQYSDYSAYVTDSNQTTRSYSKMVQNVRRDTRELTTTLVTDEDILTYFGQALDMIFGSEKRWKSLYTKMNIPLQAGVATYTLPTNYSHWHLCRYNYTVSGSPALNDSYDLYNEDELELLRDQRDNFGYTDDQIATFRIDPYQTTNIEIWPAPALTVSGSAASIDLYYFKKPTKPTSFNSTTDIDNPHLEELYAIYMINSLQHDDPAFAKNFKEFGGQLGLWKEAQYMQSQPQYFKTGNPYSYLMKRLTGGRFRRYYYT